MSRRITDLAHGAAGRLGVRVVRTSTFEMVQQRASTAERHLELFGGMGFESVADALRLLRSSRSQLQQDLFAWWARGSSTPGFFVEFGATNGVDLSNTHLLETELGWSGILAEPARRWRSELRRNRPNAHVDERCVWSRSGEYLDFIEADVPEFSTISRFADADHHSASRQQGAHFAVETITLDDLLDAYDAPAEIDFLSIDTEGSEFEILEAHDWKSRTIRAITCEHNHAPKRDEIYALLDQHGYERVFEDLSLWDDWYVLRR